MKKLVYSLLTVCLMMGLVACGGKTEEVELKKDEFTVEYGKKLSTNPSTYLDTDSTSILDSAKVTFDDYKKDGDANYPAVGAYMGEITYKEDKKEKTKKLVVRVKDTVAPKFEDFEDTIHLVKGSIDSDLRKYFYARDLSTVTITVDSSKVDFASEGEYKITVTATDEHGNSTEKEAKVVIMTEEKETTPTPDPVYACADALYNKDKICSYIPEDQLLVAPYVNFYTEEEWKQYIADNGLEDYLNGYYEVKNNGKESVKVWYVNPEVAKDKEDDSNATDGSDDTSKTETGGDK